MEETCLLHCVQEDLRETHFWTPNVSFVFGALNSWQTRGDLNFTTSQLKGPKLVSTVVSKNFRALKFLLVRQHEVEVGEFLALDYP